MAGQCELRDADNKNLKKMIDFLVIGGLLLITYGSG